MHIIHYGSSIPTVLITPVAKIGLQVMKKTTSLNVKLVRGRGEGDALDTQEITPIPVLTSPDRGTRRLYQHYHLNSHSVLGVWREKWLLLVSAIN